MRLSILLLLIGVCTVSASTVHSQVAGYSLELTNASVKQAIAEIEKNSEYVFAVAGNISNEINTKVNLHVRNEAIEKILDRMLAGTGLSYKVIDKQIVLFKHKSDLQEMNRFPASPQQKIQLTGHVTDASNEPLIGVSVLVKGTTRGTVTDIDGRYELAAETGSTLIFSYVGYVSQEIAVASQTVIHVKLQENTQAIEEVVVVGYGTQKKVNLSGSVSSVDIGKMSESRPITNLSSALYGAAPGVYVNSGDNRPSNSGEASINVRGQGTLNNSSPLVIVDGVESSMASVNPQDIATISVLKDAASSAIYGSRAANGVILVTTKNGNTGAMKIDYNGYVSIENIRRPYEVLSNYADHMSAVNQAFVNSGKPKQFSDDVIALWRSNENNPDSWLYPNTNAFDMYKTGISQQHNLSASGGSEKVTFYTSFNYLNNPGVLENTGYKRYSVRLNLDAKLKSWIKIGANINGYTDNSPIQSDYMEDIYSYALTGGTPGNAHQDPAGRLGINPNSEDDPQNGTSNPYVRLRNKSGDINGYNLKTRFYGVLTPVKGLTLQASYSYDYYNKTKTEKPEFVELWNFQTGALVTDGKERTYIYNYDEKRMRNFMDATASYTGSFFNKRLDFTILGGASQEQFHREYHDMKRYDLLDPTLGVIDGAIGDAEAKGNITEWAMQSYFGRINLAWEDRYLLEANLRADGSSRFLKNNRWGYFPSFSLAWRISEESFMQKYTWLDNLKLRFSYGSLGNNSLGADKDQDGNYSSLSTFSQTNYILNRAVQMGLSQTEIANAMLTWETTRITNVGLDFNLFGNRLGGTVEWFNKYTKDILIDLPAPMVHGNATIPRQNAAEVSNKGIELSLTWNDKIGSDFTYNVGVNLTHIKNKVEKFRGDVPAIDGNRMLLEGMPKDILYVLQVDRMVQTDEDLALVQSMLDNAPLDEKGNKLTVFPYGTPQKGDFLYKDVNHDGLVNDDDRVTMGSGSAPTLTYGFSLGGAWKVVDFSILLQGVANYKDVYQSILFNPGVRMGRQLNKEVVEGSWYEGRTTPATYPRLLESTDKRNQMVSDFWVADKNYLKIRNIQLGYTLPQAWTRSAYLDRVRIYGSLENFFTFTHWKGYDPEVDGVTYPTMKEVVFGINVSF
ncbi:MAG: TonB-dependent receptor [Parabacteroides sp.]|nr:TonB-dependent receptor [Parabacteroides sp.]